MSNSDLKEEKKKRKRQEEGTEEAPKKSKKSKKAEDAPEVKEKKKDKKAKKKKNTDDNQAPATEQAAEVAEVAEKSDDVTMNDDFIPLGVDDAPIAPSNGTLSRKDSKKDKKSKKSKDESAEKKSKKDKKDKKSKKPKQDDEVPQGEVADAMEVDVVGNIPETETEVVSKDDSNEAKEKKDKKSKKDKTQSETVTEELNGEDGTATKRSKKDKKKSKKEKKSAEESTEQDATAKESTDSVPVEEEPVANGDATDAQPAQEGEGEGEESGKKGRFIIFVGNLPFSATKETIEAHFEKLKPFEVRLRTYKGDNKFMGTCFIEFDRFDHMQTALTKYHHSVFPDPKKKEGRKINVELSAGGGGNNAARQEKIKAKNEKLSNERIRIRERRDEIEAKQKERKDKKAARQGGKDSSKNEADGAADVAEKEPEPESEAAPENSAIHPARLAMMQEKPKPWLEKRENAKNSKGPRYGGHRKRY